VAAEWSSLLWFAVIVVAIPFALWFVKRTPLGHHGSAGTPRVVAVLPLATSQRLVTVEVGRGEQRMWLLLGVTPQGITNLTTMAPQDDPAAAPPQSPAEAFAPLLQRLRQSGRRSTD
jgi:flagellar protein FliO/FliZ